MTEIAITPMEPNVYGVQVTEGDVNTSHRVRVPEDLFASGVPEAGDHERLIEESFLFLLEREPATSILPEFSLVDISKYFPEYREEVSRRLAG